MKRILSVFIGVVFIIMSLAIFVGCGDDKVELSTDEQAIIGRYELTDIRLTVSTGTFGYNQESHNLFASQLSVINETSFYGISVEKFREIYETEKESIISFEYNKRIEDYLDGYHDNSNGTLDFKWKMGINSVQLDTPDLKFYGFDNTGMSIYSNSKPLAWVVEKDTLQFSIISGAGSIAYFYKKAV